MIAIEAELLSVKKVGAYRHLVLIADGIPERFRPGNFVALTIGGPMTARLARRHYWVQHTKPTGAYGGTIDLVVEPRGAASRWLAGLAPGSKLPLTGPLGRPFALPKEPVTCALVGHGYGLGPMFPLAERLRERGCAVHMVAAADDEAHLFAALEARRAASSVTVVTGDGSVGVRGVVGDALPGVLERTDSAVVYACGPHGMLHDVARAAEQHGAWSQTALEIPGACGTGVCDGCPVAVVGEDGVTRVVRACCEGPVFRGDRVRWDDLGTIPPDSRGAR